MPRILRNFGSARPSQYRNAESALGQTPAFLTYVGTWFSGIFIGVALIALIVGLSAFGTDTVPTARASVSYDNVAQNPTAFNQDVQAGQKLFQANCQACHADGGRSANGIGPRLAISNNAEDASYVHTIVRNGLYPMPAFSTQQLNDQQLFQITAYIHSIRQVNQK